MLPYASSSPTTTATESSPLLNQGPSTLVDASSSSKGRLPKPIAAVPVDPDVLDDFRKQNFVWKLVAISVHLLLLLPGLLFLLIFVRPRWDDVPDHLLFGTTKEACRILLLFTGWMGIGFAFLGWRHLRPPVSSRITPRFVPAVNVTPRTIYGAPRTESTQYTVNRTEVVPRLPLSHSQWVALRDSMVAEEGPVIGSGEDDNRKKYVERALEVATWWAAHPVSLSQRSEFSVRVWLLWTASASLLGQGLLISGFLFPFYNIDSWPWALIPLALLSLSPAVASLVHLFLSRNLRHAPIEDRGVGEGIQVQGLDLTADLLREPKKFDPCECFPQPVAYALGDILSFFFLL